MPRNKVLKTLGYVRNFTYLGAANITSKQKSDMTKVAIKNEKITSFGGIYHIMDVFSKCKCNQAKSIKPLIKFNV